MLDLEIVFCGNGAYGRNVDIYVDNHRFVFARVFYSYTKQEILKLIRQEMRQKFGVKRFKTTIRS